MRPPAAGEMRGLWVTRSWMTTPAQVSQVVGDAERHGFTAIFVQVRGRGDAFYRGGPDPRATLLARQPSTFDPLAELVERARAAGVQVHAWLNVNLVAGATAMPVAPQHVTVQHPEWVMVPRQLADTVLRLSPRDPRYLSTIAAWSARHSATIEGVFSSPIAEGAQARLEATVDHLTAAYPLDGLHLDYIRYPSPDFDVSRSALDSFRAALVPELTPKELAALDARAASAPLTLVDEFGSRWSSFRRARLTRLVTRLGTAARANRPGLRLTAAVWPEARQARDYKLQDWAGWLRDGLIDAACPMMYTSSGASFEQQLRTLAANQGTGVWPGIGAYKISADESARRIDLARAMGFTGVLLYSYDSMTGGQGRSSAYLATLQRRAFPASSPARAGADR